MKYMGEAKLCCLRCHGGRFVQSVSDYLVDWRTA